MLNHQATHSAHAERADLTPDEFLEIYDVNPFIDTADDNLSTFALDVDTASYTIARNALNNNTLPNPDLIRSEEFINYFDANYASPEEEPFAIYMDAVPSPFGADNHHLMRVGIQGLKIEAEERDPANLIFVIDVSGSMGQGNVPVNFKAEAVW